MKQFAERHARGKKTTSKPETQTNRIYFGNSFIKLYNSPDWLQIEAINRHARKITRAIESWERDKEAAGRINQ
jgi:hypothetical protein